MKYTDVIAMRIDELLKQKNLNTNSFAIKSGIMNLQEGYRINQQIANNRYNQIYMYWIRN